MSKISQLWDPIQIEPAQTLSLQLGPLNLWVHRGDNEWYVAHEYELQKEERFSIEISENDFPQDKTWTRWIVNDETDSIRLSPRLPDQPVIVRPEMPMSLLPKQSVQFFVGIPVWLTLSFGSGNLRSIEIPSVTLSKSWFGPVTAGELCYALKTTAKLHQTDLLSHAHRAVFPLEIRNISSETMSFERLCLRVQFLNVYRGKTRVWTNKGRVSYRGEENWSRVVYTGSAPEFDDAGQLLGTAREPVSRGMILKTFDNLKQLADI